MVRTLTLLLFCQLSVSAQQIIVTPYLQPGNAPTLEYEEKVIIWQTDNIVNDFKVEYGIKEGEYVSAKIQSTHLNLGGKQSILYRAVLPNLVFDQRYYYRVSLKEKIILEKGFNTRSKKPESRFVVFGDCGVGFPVQAEIAYQAYLKEPQFVLITGDNVYSRGLMSEYLAKYFPFFNRDDASPEKGAPLMRSIPFYLTIGNHDIAASDLSKYPDGLSCYYYFDLPLNSPVFKKTVVAVGDAGLVDAFKKATAARFPAMSNYSFDHGNVHITCLDANRYINPNDPELINWIEKDISNSKATWKIVAFHHPGIHSSNAHYDAQWMRVLSPLFERLKVDLVMNGHVHNYQRSHPLYFEPAKDSTGKPAIAASGRVDGEFTLDKKFNGRNKTKPKGVIYIVSGAGGAGLYDTAFSNKPGRWNHKAKENWVPYTVRHISHIHSFSLIETENDKLIFRQFDPKGNELDRIKITK